MFLRACSVVLRCTRVGALSCPALSCPALPLPHPPPPLLPPPPPSSPILPPILPPPIHLRVGIQVAGPLDALDMCLDQRQVLECAEEVNDALVAAVGQGRGARLPVGSTSCLLGLPRRAHHAVVPVYLLEYTFR